MAHPTCTPTPVTPNGRVALVTGANSGIGRVTAVELALQGFHVFLACRTADKAGEVLREISQRSAGTAKAEFLPLDLGDLDSVRQCAQAFNARDLPLHLLVNNAGLAGQKGFTRSGFELAFGVCHVGHFLLTRLLLDRLKAAAPSRVVVVASRAHRHAKGIDFTAVRQPSRSRGGLMDYSVAKLANILFAAELGRRLAGTGVTTYSLHPGVVATGIWRVLPWPVDRMVKLFMIGPEEGAKTTLYCATSDAVAQQSGLYYVKSAVATTTPAAADAELAKALWTASEGWTEG
ncbi:MAG: SDR family NAD(P)-dependent oxidoreductase [Burkholderiaceae bacterium]|nr:SDR family NAD(P)-dependent oxidoreductase [Burkholderiaceae bacterium]